MKYFAGKTALITGAASGIGRGIAIKCATENMKIAIVDRDEANLEKVKHEILNITPHVIALCNDVSRPDDNKKLITQVQQKYNSINLLINNAGVSGPLGPVWEIPLEQLNWTLDINLKSVISLLQNVIPLMIKQNDECHIVNVSSHVGLISNPHLTAYQITKHAIVTLTESLQKDLEIYGHDKIGTSVFFPYFVKSNLAKSNRHLLKYNQELFIAEKSQQFLQLLSDLTNNGIDAITAAEILFAGIHQNNFYIYTNIATEIAFNERALAITNEIRSG